MRKMIRILLFWLNKNTKTFILENKKGQQLTGKLNNEKSVKIQLN